MEEKSIKNRVDLDRQSIDVTIDTMNKAFKDANVRGYRNLVEAITLPDPDDRHVVAAAIRCNADLILTENIKDFPQVELVIMILKFNDRIILSRI